MKKKVAVIENTDKARFENKEWQNLMSEFSLKVNKTFMGREGHGFNATLYRNGKKVADIHDMADGGICGFYWRNMQDEYRFEELVKKLPLTASKYFPDGLKVSNDATIAFLAHCNEMRQKIKKARNPKVVFSDGEKTYELRNIELTNEVREWISKNHPNAFIWNDHL